MRLVLNEFSTTKYHGTDVVVILCLEAELLDNKLIKGRVI
jgi:hypothetical protein